MYLYDKIRRDIASHEHELIIQTDVFLFLYMVFFNITTSLNDTNKYCNAIAAVFIILAGLYFIHNPGSMVNLFSVSFTLFVIYAFFSAFWSPVRETSLLEVRTLSRILVLSVLMYNYLDTQGKKDIILSGFVVAGLVASVYTILYYGPGAFIQGMKNGSRMGWGIYSINYVSVMLMLAALIALWFVFYRKKWWDVVPAVICVIVALSTGCRAALISFVAGLFALIFLSFKGKWKLLTPLLMILLLTAAWFIIKLPMFASVYRRMEGFFKVFSEGSGDGSSNVRIEMIKWGFGQFLKTPVLGLGISSGSVVMAQHGEPGLGLYHNTYIEVLAGLGIIGFALYFSMLFYPLVKLFKPAMARKDDAVIAMVMLVVLLVAFVFGSEYNEKATYVIICYLFLTVSHYKKEGFLK